MNFNRIYTINYDKLISWLLPTFLRKVTLFRWLQALVAPIKILYSDFLIYRQDTIYKLSHNGQICYLQKVLNDALDQDLRRIAIKNGVFLQPLYIYTKNEQNPVYLGQSYIYANTDFNKAQNDFTICIPIALKPVGALTLENYINNLNALMSQYKLASKTYTIQWIN